MSEQEIVRVAAWFLAGWAFGAVTVLVFGWRRLTRPWHSADDWRLLRLQLRDADAQIGALYAQIGRLTGRLALAQRGDATTREGAA